MARKKKINRKIEPQRKDIHDTVVFLTAYNVHKTKHHLPSFRSRCEMYELLDKYHISGMSCDNTYISTHAKYKYAVEYDSLRQVSSFIFDEDFVAISKNDPRFADDVLSTISIHHSSHSLLDTQQVDIPICFNLESFLVRIDSELYQVDSGAFFMNDSIIIYYELIDFETGIPLKCTEIHGRRNNYNIKQINALRYFNESEFATDDRKISDIIFQTIFDFLTELSKNRLQVGNYSYVHNILVFSNEVNDVQEYFQKVLDAKICGFHCDNISTTDAFDYHSTEYLGLLTSITSKDIGSILYTGLMLESFKTYLLLKMIVDFQVNHQLNVIVRNQIFIESLLYPNHVPVITINLINNLRKTVSFARYKQAIDFKIQALKIKQEKQRTNNGVLMNVLLYILALLGSFQTLQVMQTEFNLPFKISFWIVLSIFVTLGIIWIIREIKKN